VAKEDQTRSKVRHSVETLAGIIGESAKIYREMRDDKLDHLKGRSLIWVLSQLRATVETQTLERLEERLNEMTAMQEGRPNGYPRTNRPPRPRGVSASDEHSGTAVVRLAAGRLSASVRY
jgi:hypothetical protein